MTLANRAVLRIQVLEVRGLQALDRAYGSGGLRSAVTESNQVIYAAPGLLTENAVRLSGIEANSEVALAVLPPPPPGIDATQVAPILSSATLDLVRVQSVGVPTVAEGGTVSGKLWEAWLELGAAEGSDFPHADAAQLGACMRISVLMEGDFDVAEKVTERILGSPVPSEPSCVMSSQSMRAAAPFYASEPSVLFPGNSTASVVTQRSQDDQASTQIQQLQSENRQLRAELDEARRESAQLRKEHEEDRRRVQETLRGLEADVHTRWQRYVAELEAEITRLTSAAMSVPIPTTPPTPTWPQHAASCEHRKGGFQAPPGVGCASSRGTPSAPNFPAGGLHWPEIVDRGSGTPLLDGPHMTPQVSSRGGPPGEGVQGGTQHRKPLSGSAPSAASRACGGTAGLQPPPGLSVRGLGPNLQLWPHGKSATTLAAPAFPAAPTPVPSRVLTTASVPAPPQSPIYPNHSVCTAAPFLTSSGRDFTCAAPPTQQRRGIAEGNHHAGEEGDSNFFGLFDAMGGLYSQVISGMQRQDSNEVNVNVSANRQRELVMDPVKAAKLNGASYVH
mmetsp:Transcript_28239/g.65305  ORF Transcript_28239/g.65305 Transcript_28239/m.65305 type:complete len:561 (+) Transcript_28239:45-1727(+)